MVEITTVNTRTITICGYCEQEVYTCNNCGEYLKDNDKICCHNESHFCESCTEAKLEMEKDKKVE